MQSFNPRKFNADWYIRQNPDVALSGMDPYEHYKLYGKTEGRLPMPPVFQVHNKIDVVLLSIKKNLINVIKVLYHRLPLPYSFKKCVRDFCFQRIPFIFHGVASYESMRLCKFTSNPPSLEKVNYDQNWNLMLPSGAAKSGYEIISSSVVDVIIPVYRGFGQTQRCIDSVLNSTPTVETPFRLILINDASPEVEVTNYLRSLPTSEHIILVENSENLGFTATVNKGMTLSDKNDVLLLNSDTEVANDWLDKLKAQAYSISKAGSVTPFSNNATICNYPTLDGMKELPNGESVASLDAAFSSANMKRNIEIPTAVGFCMYIRRDCLNEVGLFDVETFGKGYGEENDFCLRATAKGWKHLLAADTFVYHEGEVSFQAGSNPRKERAANIIRERYPEYEASVAKHVTKNEAYPLRVAATAARFKQSKLPTVLHVLHAHGGGTEKHVEELCRHYFGKAKLLVMTPSFDRASKPVLQVRSTDPSDALNILLSELNIDFLVSLFQSFGVSLIHIHHLLGYSVNIRYLVGALGVPFYLTVHDYFLICPRINLMPPKQNYCGEPGPSECNQCLSVDAPNDANDIIWWREKHSWLFDDARTVICPSHDVMNRCYRYFSNATYRVASHEKIIFDVTGDLEIPILKKNEPLRVVIIGVLARHKGLELIVEVLRLAMNIDAPLQFHLIGYVDGDIPTVPSVLFTQTGRYDEAMLSKMLGNYDPHLILFPVRCPETYSYTLTAALNSRRPIMVPNIGAFPERVESRPWTWVFDRNITPNQLIDNLCEMRTKNFHTATPPVSHQMAKLVDVAIIEDSDFYEKEYLPDRKIVDDNCSVIDIRSQGKITALIIVEGTENIPSPCAYIRLILPLTRERGDKFDFRWVTYKDVSHYKADVLIIQRTAVIANMVIDKIVDHCRENNIRIIYDIDDFLLELPDDHPEHLIYATKSAAVFRWLLEASEVWVSTEALREKIIKINPATHVVPNYVDELLWAKSIKQKKNSVSEGTVRLLYMGTQTHSADFGLVKNVLKKLKQEFSDRIEISLIGISSDFVVEKWYKIIAVPHGIGSKYPAFVNWICNESAFDIGIAPLVDNEFNRCKSTIKYFDYSALGLVTVASDLNGYGVIRNGENGFKVDNTEDAWYKALKSLITNSTLRSKIQLTAQNEIFEIYGYRSVLGLRMKLLTSLLSMDTVMKGKQHTVILRNNEESVGYHDIKLGRNIIASAFLSGIGIEVGALHNPLPVPSEVTVRYVDRMDKRDLYEQYPELRKHNLVDVDFVDNGETLLTFAENSQDFIIANHFLEHCEDPIATLKAFFRVLRSGGVVFLALPDKRFTFDKNRQRTTLAHLLRDHYVGAHTSRHEHFLEWPTFVEPHFGRVYATAEEIETRACELMSQNYSIHYHVWEPSDVYELLQYCADEQGLPLKIEYFVSMDDEMIVILRKNA